MTTPRDPDRLIRAFLDEGSIELPDRTYDAVRDHIERTRQRAVLGPWKEPVMPMIARFAAAAAVVIVAAGIGLGLIAGSGRVSGPPASTPTSPPASASPTVAPTPIPVVGAVPPDYRWPMALGPGTYQTDFGYDLPVALRFTVGPGWTGYDISMEKDASVSLRVLAVENLFEDGCNNVLLDPPVGPTVGDLANAIAALPTVDATAPVDAALGGVSGRALDYTMRSDVNCYAAQLFRITPSACEPAEMSPTGCHTGAADIGFELALGERNRTWVLDVGGRGRLVVQAISTPSATAADLADLEAVLDSLEIVRTVPVTPEPQP